jgi:hypothetical protein
VSRDPVRAERRARRLLRCYPPAWRARYGDEFTQLLLDEFAERPRAPRRTVDVVLSGVLARLVRAGVAGDGLEAQAQMRASLALLGGTLSAFLVLGIAIWSQLTIGWQWSAPSSPATRAGMLLMSAAVAAFAVLAILAAAPLVRWASASLRRHGRRTLPALTGIWVGTAVLILGSLHFGQGWPGTGGHAWPGRELVPSAVARFGWAATLWMTSYWAHPGRLAAFPATELIWMVASPAALLAVLVGGARLLRTLPLSAATLRYELRVGAAAAVAMAVLLAGAGSWVISGGAAPRGLFRVGALDAAGVAAMSAALLLGYQALRRGLAAVHATRT